MTHRVGSLLQATLVAVVILSGTVNAQSVTDEHVAKGADPKMDPLARARLALQAIPRKIAREPSYAAARQYYACLAFGPDAARHMWVVIDGESLYADLNGNGDLTEEGERFAGRRRAAKGLFREMVAFYPETIPPRRGRRGYDGFHLNLMRYRPGHRLTPADPAESLAAAALAALTRTMNDPHVCTIYVHLSREGIQHAQVVMGRSPADAPFLHYDGPLTLGLVETLAETTLWRGEVPAKITLAVGTPGLGRSFVRTSHGHLPEEARPEATFRYLDAEGRPFFRTVRFKGKC